MTLHHISDDGKDNILIEFGNHPSFKTIKQNFNITGTFSFQPASLNDGKQVVKYLNSSKYVDRYIPTNILKDVM